MTQIDAEEPAIMYYTSGSTGHPKAVVHASRAIYAWRSSAIYWLDLRPGERIWCTADTGWSKAGTSIPVGPWSCGACSLFDDGPFVPKERLGGHHVASCHSRGSFDLRGCPGTWFQPNGFVTGPPNVSSAFG